MIPSSGRFNLKAAVEREKAVQAIDVHREWKNCVVTFWVMSQFLHFLGASRGCADFRVPTVVLGSRRLTRPEQQVKVVGHEGPGETAIAEPGNPGRQAFKKVGTILIGTEDGSPFHASAHHIIQRPRQRQARLSQHGESRKRSEEHTSELQSH